MNPSEILGSAERPHGPAAEIEKYVLSKAWLTSPLGEVKGWPQSLKFSVNLCLKSHLPVAVWWSRDLLVIYNDALRRILDLKHPEALGSRGADVLSGALWYNLEQSLNAVLEKGEPTELQNDAGNFQDDDTERNCTTFYNVPIFDENGRVTGVFTTVVTDLTDSRTKADALELKVRERTKLLERTNEALKKSEERYIKMTEEVQDYAIILLDVDGTILNWNKGAQNIKGYTENEIIGQNFSVFYLEEDRKNNLPEKLIRMAGEEGRAMNEGLRKRKDGTTFWGSIVITALHDENNRVIGFTKVTRDLTERKTAEDKMRQHAAELEVKNRQLEQFAYIASHDLQEPLRKIQTFVEILEKKIDNEEVRNRYYAKIATSAKRMGQLIQSVLNYSRLSQTRELLLPTDLNIVLENVLADYELLIEEKKAVIRYDRLPIIQGIELLLGQLFSNLIGNALKFSDTEPLISITWRIIDGQELKKLLPAEDPSGNYLELTFKDNGIGFDQQYSEKIFNIFQRLNSREEYAGTGLGLALCKKIVEHHRGYIHAKSELGRGASFFVYLPSK
jgi:PAS domain S-box-containing protein